MDLAVRTTASPTAIWVIVIVMTICTGILVSAVGIADSRQSRASRRAHGMISLGGASGPASPAGAMEAGAGRPRSGERASRPAPERAPAAAGPVPAQRSGSDTTTRPAADPMATPAGGQPPAAAAHPGAAHPGAAHPGAAHPGAGGRAAGPAGIRSDRGGADAARHAPGDRAASDARAARRGRRPARAELPREPARPATARRDRTSRLPLRGRQVDQRSQRRTVSAGGAEGGRGRLGPLEVQVGRVLPGEADAAVQLDAFLRRRHRGVAAGRLGQGDRDRGVRVVVGQAGGGVPGGGPGQGDRRSTGRRAGA